MVSFCYTYLMNIIFVCHGNICRSPLGEILLNNLLTDEEKKRIHVFSRATSLEEIGNDVYPPMKRELYRRGITLYPHAAQRIRQADYEAADYIFCMDDENYYSLLRQLDNHKNIIYRINRYTPNINEIEDPWYTGRYEKVCDEITDCIHDIFKNI